MKEQKVHFNCIGVLSFFYGHQRVSATHVAFFRMTDFRTLLFSCTRVVIMFLKYWLALPILASLPLLGAIAPSEPRALHYRGFTITLRHITLGRDSSGRVISPPQISVPDNTQHSQETDIHEPSGIRTRNPSKRAAANQRFRPRVYWDRPRLLPCSRFVCPCRT
jgi:hypothetical protein